MGVLFGTDGVRGVANQDLTPELAYKLGQVGAYCLAKDHPRPKILTGKDTRMSGDMLEGALIAGICSVGGDAVKLDVIPTPGVAYLIRYLEAQAGIMISASHNPMEDNGIKFFGPNGYKLPDDLEKEIENLIATKAKLLRPIGADIGRTEFFGQSSRIYGAYLKKTLGIELSSYKIVVDTANGAAYSLAPNILRDLGAEVIPLFNSPNGTNINQDCGSTHPEKLMAAVKNYEAHLGLAFDGDADRVLAVDEQGNLIDGDQIMVICALDLLRRDLLTNKKIVVTVMSNLGLHQALNKAGIETLVTKVGDRYVLEEMLTSGAVMGGEQSGHIIFHEFNTTGDGIATALQLLKVMVETGKPLSRLAGQMTRLPQKLVNVSVQDQTGWADNPSIQEAILQAEKNLEDRGRILVRPSGTEPLIRVMGEGPDIDELDQIIRELSQVIERELG